MIFPEGTRVKLNEQGHTHLSKSPRRVRSREILGTVQGAALGSDRTASRRTVVWDNRPNFPEDISTTYLEEAPANE